MPDWAAERRRLSGDQEFAATLVWIVVTFAYLAPAAVVTLRMPWPSL